MDEHVLTKGKYILADPTKLSEDKTKVTVIVLVRLRY